MQLSIFFDLFKNNPAGEPLAQRVAQSLVGQTSSYYTTQELVWGVTGLGKWVTALAAKGVAGGTLSADGTTINARTTKQKSNDRTWTLYRASEYKKLAIDIPQSAAGMWLVIRSEGVKQGATYKTGGNGMIVSRTYRQQDGTQIDPDGDGAIKLGDVIFVEVELRNSSGAAINNIALVDRLPAGFEIENARLGRGLKVDWAKDEDLWAVDFQNMRDDRVEAFGHMPATTTKKIVYTVRAVTSGKFTIPPSRRAMYDPTLWARARVEQPSWADRGQERPSDLSSPALAAWALAPHADRGADRDQRGVALLFVLFAVPLPDRDDGWSTVVEYRDGAPAPCSPDESGGCASISCHRRR
jgi:uncharacterized repeat protein (TIGR01451 family)